MGKNKKQNSYYQSVTILNQQFMNGANQYLNISAQIEKITNLGEVHIKFNESMRTNFTDRKSLVNLTSSELLSDEQIMALRVIPSNLHLYREDYTEKNIEFKWNVTYFNRTKMIIKLDFSVPQYISPEEI